MEADRISRIAFSAISLLLWFPAGTARTEEDRKTLTFTKSDHERDAPSWTRKPISTGAISQTPRKSPSKARQARLPVPQDSPASEPPTPTSKEESMREPMAVPRPEGVVPTEKIETDYQSLKRELAGLRPLERDAPPSRPAKSEPGPVAIPKPAKSEPETRPSGPPPPPVGKPATTASSQSARPVRIPVSRSRPGSSSTPSKTASVADSRPAPAPPAASPPHEDKPKSGRGFLSWFKRDRNRLPGSAEATDDGPIPAEVSGGSGEGSGELIASYPPPDHYAEGNPGEPGTAAEPRGGFFGRLFGKSEKGAEASTPREIRRTALDQFPKLEEIRTKASKAELEIDTVVRQIQDEYESRIERITASDLSLAKDNGSLAIPRDFESVWFKGIQNNLWKSEERIAVPLREAYARALMNSNQVSVVSYIPLIGETGIGEAEGQFDPEFFANGRRDKIDRPTNSELDTGTIGRFIEDGTHGEVGVRKRFAASGGQVALSNRFSSLKNNSDFTLPNPQSTSDLVLAVRQPLLRGAGYHYNKATLKIAKLEASSAAGEYIRLLEDHLLEVNRAYWGVYLARAAFLLRQSLVEQTAAIVDRIESRPEEATPSELLRANSELSTRRTAMNRAEMAVRNAEERLRSLVNDPEFPIGGAGEFVPMTRPVLDPPVQNVKGAAREAVDNRTEIAQSFNRLRSAAIIEEAGRSELRPQLDLLGEVRYGGIDEGRRLGGAYEDMFRHGTGWMAGLEFSQAWERNFAKARQQRRTYEFLQQADTVRHTIDNVLLESVVTYRELMTAYRDMQGRYQEVISTRKEVEALQGRLEIDVNDRQTIAFRLQLIMDAIERNQIAEEQFLVSIATYNIAFAALDRAKGTFLTYHDVAVSRVPDDENGKGLQSIKASSPYAPASPGESRSK